MKFDGVFQSRAAIFFAVMALLAPQLARAQAAACTAGETLQTFTFPAGSWAAGTLGPYPFNVGAGATAVTLTFTSVAGVPFDAGFPRQQLAGSLPNTLVHQHSGTAPLGLNSIFNVTFSRAVSKLRWVATDVDYNNAPGAWQDAIVATSNAGLPTAMTGGAVHTITLATGTVTATGAGNCLGADATCNVTNDFNYPAITNALMQYRAGPANLGGPMFVGWDSFSWCLPAAPVPPPVGVPTLSEWGIILLAALLAAAAAATLRKRPTA